MADEVFDLVGILIGHLPSTVAGRFRMILFSGCSADGFNHFLTNQCGVVHFRAGETLGRIFIAQVHTFGNDGFAQLRINLAASVAILMMPSISMWNTTLRCRVEVEL